MKDTALEVVSAHAEEKAAPAGRKPSKWEKVKKDMRRNWPLYLMILPVVVFFIVFSYFPMAGLLVSFKDYSTVQGIFGSPWATDLAGNTDILFHFKTFFSDPYFGRLLRNTVIFSLMDIVFVFPAPIVVALLMHSIQNKPYRRVTSTMMYMPYFISMVVVCGIVRDFTSVSGIFSVVAQKLGIVADEAAILGDTRFFRWIVIISNIWQATGYGSIIYIAALCSIDTTLYEAADIDGAGRMAKLFRITIPSIMPTIMVMLIMNVGRMLTLGFEKVLLMYTPNNASVSDILDTLVYRTGLANQNYSYATAIGLFTGVIGVILVTGANALSRKVTGESVY